MKLFLLVVAVALMMVLSLGASSALTPTGRMVAHAGSLSPQPVALKSPVSVVETRTVNASIPVAQSVPAPVVGENVIPVGVGGLFGSIGFALPYGNCVNQINPRPNGNPSSWPVRSQTPTIGSAALFRYNHVGRVVGIWSNGDLEISHENYKGGQHRFPRSTFRGFW